MTASPGTFDGFEIEGVRSRAFCLQKFHNLSFSFDYHCYPALLSPENAIMQPIIYLAHYNNNRDLYTLAGPSLPTREAKMATPLFKKPGPKDPSVCCRSSLRAD